MAIHLTQPVRVVGFIGKAGSGKTTAAYHLQYGYTRIRFADRLKKMLKDGLDIDKEYIDGDKKNEPCEELGGQTCRHGMITLGTEWGRDMIHPDIWVNALARDMGIYVRMGVTKFVIDDVRFLNEGAWIRNLNLKGINAKLVRILRNVEGGSIDHRSETEQDAIGADWEIWNNGTLEEFYRSIDEALSAMFRKES